MGKISQFKEEIEVVPGGGIPSIRRPEVQNAHRRIEIPETTTLLGCFHASAISESISEPGYIEGLERALCSAGKSLHDRNAIESQLTCESHLIDNFAIRIADSLSKAALHEIVSCLLQYEDDKLLFEDDNDCYQENDVSFLVNNSLAKSFLQIQISKYEKDGLLPIILKDHFVMALSKKLATDDITLLVNYLDCPELVDAFSGFENVRELTFKDFPAGIEEAAVTSLPLEEKKPAPTVYAVLCSAVKFGCKVGFRTLCAAFTTMSVDYLTKPFGLTSSIGSSLQDLVLKPIAYSYDMSVTALHSAALSLTSKESEATRTAVSAAIVFGGACMLASMLYSHCKATKAASTEVSQSK